MPSTIAPNVFFSWMAAQNRKRGTRLLWLVFTKTSTSHDLEGCDTTFKFLPRVHIFFLQVFWCNTFLAAKFPFSDSRFKWCEGVIYFLHRQDSIFGKTFVSISSSKSGALCSVHLARLVFCVLLVWLWLLGLSDLSLNTSGFFSDKMADSQVPGFAVLPDCFFIFLTKNISANVHENGVTHISAHWVFIWYPGYFCMQIFSLKMSNSWRWWKRSFASLPSKFQATSTKRESVYCDVINGPSCSYLLKQLREIPCNLSNYMAFYAFL